MPDVSDHPPGRFCWTDLNTPDPAGAKAFYATLFGWTFDDRPLEGGSVYSLASKRQRQVAAITGMMPDSERLGVPPHWNVYFAVQSADRAADDATRAGGKVLAPPFDVFDEGRMAVIADPGGAAFCVWEPRQHRGAQITGEHGAPAWVELETSDPAAAARFYASVLGWKAETLQMGPGQYTVFNAAGERTAGMMAMSPETPKGTPSSWTPYFAVDEIDGIIESAQELGVTMEVPPTDIPDVGRFAMFFDPQGAFVAVLQPLPR